MAPEWMENPIPLCTGSTMQDSVSEILIRRLSWHC
jgi:hypothetical protein